MPKDLTIRDKQIWLNRNGFTDNKEKKLVEDGLYGNKTKEAEMKVGTSPLELNRSAIDGYPGIWSHTNVRIDKTDIFPQPELMNLLKSL